MNISVVIITRNEAHIIGNTLQTLAGITDDIVIVDSGSTDKTLDICRQFNTKIIEVGWNGYGPNKNIGVDAARYEWILNLDADESIDEELARSVTNLAPANPYEMFEVRFKNFFMNKWIKYGEWGTDKHIRLFNRTVVRWNEAAVHENLVIHPEATTSLLKGHILHYTVHSPEEYQQKTVNYAKLNAQKYFEQGKHPNILKRYLSPVFSFIQNYIIRLGFLDGTEGFLIAKTTARYTYLKYSFLHDMYRSKP